MFLGIEGDHVICFDRDGVRIPTYTELDQARIAAEERIRPLEQSRRRNGGRK